MARGQAEFDYRYWFDNDLRTVRQGHSASGKWQVDAEVDGLNESVHAIHIQVLDKDGIASAPVTRYFIKTRDTNAEQGYYWFDGNSTARQLSELAQGTFSIDLSKLADGFHTFYYQIVGKNGLASSTVSRPFFKLMAPESVNYRCWIDNDLSAVTTGQYTGEPVLVDVGQVSDGFHVMHVQINGGDTPLASVTRPFIKIPQTEGVDYLKCLCHIDGEFYMAEDVPSAGGVINRSLDVSSLAEGIHKIMIQVMTPSGAITSAYEAEFLRTAMVDGIFDVTIIDEEAAAGYRINGQRARTTDKGLIIKKGKKRIVK